MSTARATKPGAARAPAAAAGGPRKGAAPAAKPAPPAKSAAAPAGPAITLKIAQPGKDPRFKATLNKLNKSAAKARSHPPAGKKAAEAQAAALPPPNEKLAGANANKADKMAAAETGKPQPTSFLAMLRAEIQKVMPKKTEDAKGFMKGGDREKLEGAMTGNVQQQKGEATAGMQGASEAPPDTAAVPGKEVTPLAGEGAPPAPVPVDAGAGMPAPKPAQEISLEQGKKDTDKLLTDAEVTTPQLQKANDPRFTAVVTAKGEADRFADTGPKQYQTKEQKILAQSAAQASGDEKKGLAGFLGQGAKALKGVRGRQLTAKEKDELERKKVTDHIQSIFDRTKASVDKKLASLDDEVSRVFDRGTDAAIAKMKDYVESRFDDRYSGIIGKGRWLKDKLLPLPGSVKAWFEQAHKVFVQELDALVVRVAELVERRLKEAKDEIAKGQKEIREYVQGLPTGLQAVGKAAEKEMQGQFDELRQGVDDKKNDLAQKLAQRYKDASEKGAKALQELKDAHKSLYERVRDAIAEIIKVLRDFKNRIMAMLKKAKNAVDLIVSDPIGFLKNVLAAIKKGLGQFIDNIWTHLKAGFMAWLFGSIAETGVEVPKDLSLGSILKLVLQVLGLTYARLRAKAVKLLGERAVTVIEQVAKFIWVLVTEGPAKLWEMIKEYLSNLKEMIIDAIQEWLITTIIKAAVTKLVSMFNPVGAIIQAIIMIYNVVMFLIERINQILAFVESVINSVYEIATGQIGAAANWIEKALARTIPIIIAFLARLLGITGITEKIVGIVKKLQMKVDQALDKVIAKVAAGIGKLFGGKGAEDSPEKEAKVTAGLAAIDQEEEKFKKEGKIRREDAEKVAATVKRAHPVFKSLTVTDGGASWDYDYVASPGKKKKGEQKSGKEPGSTKETAIEISWYKPAISSYKKIWMAPPAEVSDARKSTGDKRPSLATIKSLDGVFSATPLKGATLDTMTIGVTDPVASGIKNGFKFQAGAKVTGNARKDAFNSAVERWGYNREDNESGGSTDGDHVWEKQLGGPDEVSNVWPLLSTTNQASGRNIKTERERIEKQYKLKSLAGVWLKLKF